MIGAASRPPNSPSADTPKTGHSTGCPPTRGTRYDFSMNYSSVITDSSPVQAKRQRRTRYPRMVSLRLSTTDYRRVETLADLEGCTMAEAMRDVLGDNLPNAIAAARKQASRQPAE